MCPLTHGFALELVHNCPFGPHGKCWGGLTPKCSSLQLEDSKIHSPILKQQSQSRSQVDLTSEGRGPWSSPALAVALSMVSHFHDTSFPLPWINRARALTPSGPVPVHRSVVLSRPPCLHRAAVRASWPPSPTSTSGRANGLFPLFSSQQGSAGRYQVPLKQWNSQRPVND